MNKRSLLGLHPAEGRWSLAGCWSATRAITHLRWVPCSALVSPYRPARRTQSPPALQSGQRTQQFVQGAALRSGRVCLECEGEETLRLQYPEQQSQKDDNWSEPGAPSRSSSSDSCTTAVQHLPQRTRTELKQWVHQHEAARMPRKHQRLTRNKQASLGECQGDQSSIGGQRSGLEKKVLPSGT